MIGKNSSGSGAWKSLYEESCLNIVIVAQVFLEHSSSFGMKPLGLFLLSYSISSRPPLPFLHHENTSDFLDCFKRANICILCILCWALSQMHYLIINMYYSTIFLTILWGRYYFLPSFYRWGTWTKENSSNFPKVTTSTLLGWDLNPGCLVLDFMFFIAVLHGLWPNPVISVIIIFIRYSWESAKIQIILIFIW